MSSLSFLSVYLSGASLILLLTAVSQAQDYDFTPAPDYDSDYNATFEYSFYSNGSSEDLEKLSERFVDPEEEEEDMGGWEEEEVTVTTATTQGTTERGGVDVHNATSLPVSLEIRTLVWTLMILISLNLQQLQPTL
ncbi:uncharacterized protein si:ch211-191i18.2 [Xiphias gladius]|uniref:uncharacterized protein si:ch211-191i18.2 n=1 Tax=Xiphias gladius TaxID=8245 RepID=UPI001A998517|nr:uncharacterized protein si:ch211-191i18.2 [Xiphias gladius]